jgi:hypothetical protein
MNYLRQVAVSASLAFALMNRGQLAFTGERSGEGA